MQVQREIEGFGGDPDHVTIMGHSSGAAFVTLLTLTQQTEGLFRSAVVMSGTTSLSADLTTYHRLAEDVGCARKLDWLSDHKYDKKIVECMQRVPAELLVGVYRGYEDLAVTELGRYSHTSPLTDGPGGLFPAPLAELMKNRRRIDTVMIGTTKNEDGMEAYAYINATASTLSDLCKSFVNSLPLTRNRRMLTYRCQKLYVDRAMEEMKARNGTKDHQFSVWTESAIAMKNDYDYFAPTFREANSLAKAGGNVYLYSFDYEKRGMESVGPAHAFDMAYVMGKEDLI